MKTIQSFVEEHKIRITVEWTDYNPNNPEWNSADHWKVILKIGRRQMTTYFSKGYGHHGAEPTAEEVLDCLAQDISGYLNARGFEDWCSEYGYDTDSRKAERIYNVIARQAKQLARFIGDEAAHDELLYNTERM